MIGSQLGNLRDREWIAKRMRNHNRPGTNRDRGRYAIRCGVVGSQIDVDENGNQAVLDNWIRCCSCSRAWVLWAR